MFTIYAPKPTDAVIIRAVTASELLGYEKRKLGIAIKNVHENAISHDVEQQYLEKINKGD